MTEQEILDFIFNEIENQNTNQYSISLISGVSDNCIRHWKKGRRTNPTLKNIIKVLDALDYKLSIKRLDDNYGKIRC